MPPTARSLPPLLPLRPFTCRLPQRAIIRVVGKDAHEFLQGLYTNDTRLLEPGGSQWGCFLYASGRVMCDAYVYQAKQVYQGQSSLLLDVHQQCREQVYEHLVEMKMRKKVKIEDVTDSLAVAACLEEQPLTQEVGHGGGHGDAVTPPAPSSTLSQALAESFLDPRSVALFPPSQHPSSSPRTAQQWVLRKKIVPLTWAPPVQPTFTSPLQPNSANNVPSDGDDSANARAMEDVFCESPYTALLMANGIAEGPTLFRDGKSLPFELNTDFLEGVNFNKGCYIGQELTHRTHVMLVTRKRTVPLFFPVSAGSVSRSPEGSACVGEGLYVSEGKEKVGEVTASLGPLGLGLLRLRYVDKELKTIPDLTLKDGRPVLMQFPAWWPPKQVRKLLKNNS